MSDRESPCRYCGMMTEMEPYHIQLVHVRQLAEIEELKLQIAQLKHDAP